MAILNTELRSVPAIGKQELLLYILENSPGTALNIATNSGKVYFCKALNMGTVRSTETFVVVQLMDDRNNLLNRFLHIDVQKIESVELINPEDVVSILSRGNVIKSNTYEPSGSLEVKRALQHFQESVLSSTGINVGIPKMELPADGLKLGRILKLTHTIQAILIELLKQEDASTSWRAAFTGISFINNDYVQVKEEGGQAGIYFPFENLHAPEITSHELTPLLMAVL